MNDYDRGNSEDDLARALSDLERRWRALGVPVEEVLQPGLSPAAVNQTIRAAMEESVRAAGSTLELSEAERWFGWHDGTPSGIEWVAAPTGMTLFTLEQALRERLMMLNAAEEQVYADAHKLWRNTWLPIARNGVGVLLALDLLNGPRADDAGEDVASVVYIDWEDPQHYYRPAPALLAAMAIWASALDTGLYSWDGTDWVYDFRAVPLELVRTRLVG